MTRTPSLGRRFQLGLVALALSVLRAPVALAGTDDGTTSDLTSANALATFLRSIADLFSGELGVAIGIIAFAAVGVYIMYARQSGQAVGSIAKVAVGLLILFGGTTMVAEIAEATGAAF